MFGTTSGSAFWLALQPSGNPLVRPSDRREARLAALCVALALIAAPLMAAYGFSYHASLADRAAAQQHERHQVEAKLLGEAPGTEQLAATAWQAPRQPTARAEWTARDGQQYQGSVPVSAGMNPGDTVTIWVDGDGNRTGAPFTSNQTIAAATLATLGSWLMFAAALGAIYMLMRVRLDRERYAAWDREWQEFDKYST